MALYPALRRDRHSLDEQLLSCCDLLRKLLGLLSHLPLQSLGLLHEPLMVLQLLCQRCPLGFQLRELVARIGALGERRL